MFFELTDKLREIERNQISPDKLTVGFVKSEELGAVGRDFGFDQNTILASQVANPSFRTEVDVHDWYTFAELRIVNSIGEDDFISIYIMKNCLLIVDIADRDGSTRRALMRSLKKIPSNRQCVEKLVCYFIETLLMESNKVIGNLREQITDMEESVVAGTALKDINAEILKVKKQVLKYFNYYNQFIDIIETLEENDNEILNEEHIIYISNLNNRVSRMRGDISSLNNSIDHLQDAYATLLDQKMNTTMTRFTVLTSIFFPLTIIVGWYGMNFQYMPEFAWKFGYLYVIGISIAVVVVLVIIGKKRKWFK